MAITGVVYSYTPHTTAWTIPATLGNINDAVAELVAANKGVAKALFGGMPQVHGFAVTGGTFPTVEVAAGILIDEDGDRYDFAAGALDVDDTADSVTYIVVKSDKTVDTVDAGSPELLNDAYAVLATVTVNSGGDDFEIESGLATFNFVYEDDLLASTVLYTGPHSLRSTTFEYDTGILTEMHDTYRGHTTDFDISINADGLPTSMSVTRLNYGRGFANGQCVADGSQLANGQYV